MLCIQINHNTILTFQLGITDGNKLTLNGVRVTFTRDTVSSLEATRWHTESFMLIIPHSRATYTAVFKLSPEIIHITNVQFLSTKKKNFIHILHGTLNFDITTTTLY